MDDLFPGWSGMMHAYRKAISELFKRGDDRLVLAWMSGCDTMEQLQDIVDSINNIVKN